MHVCLRACALKLCICTIFVVLLPGRESIGEGAPPGLHWLLGLTEQAVASRGRLSVQVFQVYALNKQTSLHGLFCMDVHTAYLRAAARMCVGGDVGGRAACQCYTGSS